MIFTHLALGFLLLILNFTTPFQNYQLLYIQLELFIFYQITLQIPHKYLINTLQIPHKHTKTQMYHKSTSSLFQTHHKQSSQNPTRISISTTNTQSLTHSTQSTFFLKQHKNFYIIIVHHENTQTLHSNQTYSGINYPKLLLNLQYQSHTHQQSTAHHQPSEIIQSSLKDKKIDNYTIYLDRKLGEGSFGTVYLGEQDTTNLKVAIKMLSKKTINKDDYIKEAIYSEIQILKSLKCENIVGCFEVMESSNFYYIIQEYCNEGQLRGLMDRKGTINQAEAISILTQICNGFVCMLSEGVIHRDLKPENILIHNGVYKICDFGFSKKMTNRRLKNQTVVGTPLYMSVQILKSEYYTSKCDIWALGFIFYEMLHGKTPWTAGSQYQLIKNIENKPLVLANHLSDSCKNLLKSMLKITEKDRIDWDALLKHPIFKGKFNAYLMKETQLQNKLKYLMSQLRYTIKSQNIDLERLFTKMGYTRQTELSFKHFNQFLKTIDSDLTHEEQVFIFTKLDIDDSNTISMSQLQTEMIKHNIPMKSKYKGLQRKDSFKIQKQTLQSKTNQTETKIVAAFLKLAGKLQKNNISLFQVFQAYDVNKDGDLTINQFRRIMKKLDDTLTQTQVQYAFSLVDFDGSGTLTFEQFYHYYCKCIGQPPKNYMSKR